MDDGMPSILVRLRRGEILVSDGAMGTMLFQRGLEPGGCPESFNIEKPDILEEIASLYLEAGAEIVQANTFGASPLKLSEYHLEDRTEEIIASAVSAVRSTVGDLAYVSGSCGPSTRILLPYGDTEPDTVYRSFERQMRALISAGVDVLCVETMTDLREAVLAVKAAKEVSVEVPVMATMTFDKTGWGFYTIMGVSVDEAAGGLEDAGADVIGSNCGNGIEEMVEIAAELNSHTSLPIIIQSNAGVPVAVEGGLRYDEGPDLFAEKVPSLIEAGVSIIGGCCGTTPEHIRAIRRAVDSHSGRSHR
jgi:5-methyltetrahydrofolate--homocysteine methyltransferase